MSEHFWDTLAPLEDLDLDDERMNRELRWREIDRHLDRVERVLEVGGGTGAFSIGLAKRGLRVTHLDLSTKMLERAEARARAEGVAVDFVQGDAADLSRFADGAFDLVLAMDGAISFSGAAARQPPALIVIFSPCLASSVDPGLRSTPVRPRVGSSALDVAPRS